MIDPQFFIGDSVTERNLNLYDVWESTDDGEIRVFNTYSNMWETSIVSEIREQSNHSESVPEDDHPNRYWFNPSWPKQVQIRITHPEDGLKWVTVAMR